AQANLACAGLPTLCAPSSPSRLGSISAMSFIDTPGVQHGANYTGRVLKPAPPVYAPRRVAEAMVALALGPRRSVTIGSVATLARLGYFMAPRLMRAGSAALMKAYFAQASRSPITDGNLFRPITEGQSI